MHENYQTITGMIILYGHRFNPKIITPLYYVHIICISTYIIELLLELKLGSQRDHYSQIIIIYSYVLVKNVSISASI